MAWFNLFDFSSLNPLASSWIQAQSAQPTQTSTPQPTGGWLMPPTQQTQPLQNRMSVDDFANSIKSKYPDYQSVDNATLVQKMIAKYPVYSTKVDVPPTPQSTFLQNAWNAIKEVWRTALWTLETAPAVVSNVAWWLLGMVWASSPNSAIGGWINDLWNYIKEHWAQQTASLQNATWLGETEKNIANGIWNVAALFTPAWVEGDIPMLTEKIAQYAPSAAKYAPTIAKVLTNAFQWAAQVESSTLASQWRGATWWELTTWWVVWAIAPTVVNKLGDAANYLKSKLMLSGLWSATNIKNIAWKIIEEGQAWSDFSSFISNPQKLSQWMLDKGITWTENWMMQKTSQAVNDASSQLSNWISSLTQKGIMEDSQAARNLLNSVIKETSNVTSPELTSLANRANELASQETFSPSDLQEIKKMWDTAWIVDYDATGKAIQNIKNQDVFNNRTALRTQIEKIGSDNRVSNIRQLNNDVATWISLNKAIAAKQTSNMVRNVVWWFWAMAWWYEGYQHGWIEGALTWMVTWIALSQGASALNSKVITTNVAKFIDTLWPVATNAIEKYITMKKPMPASIEKELNEFVTNEVIREAPLQLPAPSGQPLTQPPRAKTDLFTSPQGNTSSDIWNLGQWIQQPSTAKNLGVMEWRPNTKQLLLPKPNK